MKYIYCGTLSKERCDFYTERCEDAKEVIRFRFMVFNATFNNITVISLRSVLLVEETGVLGENHRPVASHRQTFSQNAVF